MIISGFVNLSSSLSSSRCSFCSEIFVSKVKNVVPVVGFDDDVLFVNSKPALAIGLKVFWKWFPTVNWLSGWSSDANGLGGVVNIFDVPRRYKCGDGDIVPAGVVDEVLDSLIDLSCWSSSKSCGLESTSAENLIHLNSKVWYSKTYQLVHQWKLMDLHHHPLSLMQHFHSFVSALMD